MTIFPTHEEIAECAYFIYLNEGCPAGRQTQHWQQAEKQLIADRIHDALPALTFRISNSKTAPCERERRRQLVYYQAVCLAFAAEGLPVSDDSIKHSLSLAA